MNKYSLENAICILTPPPSEIDKYNNKSKIPYGIISFTNINKNKNKNKPNVQISGNFYYIPKSGLHGFHIHESGDLTEGCLSLCSHYNPFQKNHGDKDSEEKHLGDLGNIEVKEDGSAIFEWIEPTGQLQIKNILGRSLIVHEDSDDLGLGTFEDSKTTGHSGKRILCGIIGVKKSC